MRALDTHRYPASAPVELRPARRRISAPDARRSRRGLTLIEITIAVAIVGLIAGMAVIGISALSYSELRSTSVSLAGAIKESYDRSIMEKRIQRITFDLDNHAWWVEFTEDPYALSAVEDEDDEEDIEDFLDEDTPEDLVAALKGSRAASFSPDPNFGGRKLQLPGEVHFGRVWTGMREEPFEKGLVYLHFFRGGFTEPLQLELYDGPSNGDPDRRDYITLKVRPLTGKVRMYPKRLDEPEEDRRPWEEDD